MTEHLASNLEIAKEKQATELQALLDEFKDQRAVVLGGACTGKSTLVERLADAQDMDKLVFPLLTEDEKEYVCQTPWTPEIGEVMTRLTKERVKVEVDHKTRNELIERALILEHQDVSHLPLHNQVIPWAMKKNVDVVHRADNRLDWRLILSLIHI